VAKDQRDASPLVAGQSVGLINNLPTDAEVVESVIGEARVVLTPAFGASTASAKGGPCGR
jgi:hypothetical protein